MPIAIAPFPQLLSQNMPLKSEFLVFTFPVMCTRLTPELWPCGLQPSRSCRATVRSLLACLVLLLICWILCFLAQNTPKCTKFFLTMWQEPGSLGLYVTLCSHSFACLILSCSMPGPHLGHNSPGTIYPFFSSFSLYLPCSLLTNIQWEFTLTLKKEGQSKTEFLIWRSHNSVKETIN